MEIDADPNQSVSKRVVSNVAEPPKSIPEEYWALWKAIHKDILVRPEEYKLDLYEIFLVHMKNFIDVVTIGQHNANLINTDTVVTRVTLNLNIRFNSIDAILDEMYAFFKQRLSGDEAKKMVQATKLLAQTLVLYREVYWIKHYFPEMQRREERIFYFNKMSLTEATPYETFIDAINHYELFRKLSLEDASFSNPERNSLFEQTLETLFDAFKASNEVVEWSKVLKDYRKVKQSKLLPTEEIRMMVSKWGGRIREHIESQPTGPKEVPAAQEMESLSSIKQFKLSLAQFYSDVAQLVENMNYLSTKLICLEEQIPACYLAKFKKQYQFMLNFMIICNQMPVINQLALKVIKREKIAFPAKVPAYAYRGPSIFAAKVLFGKDAFKRTRRQLILALLDPPKTEPKPEDQAWVEWLDKLAWYFEMAFKKNLLLFYKLTARFELLSANEQFVRRARCRQVVKFLKKLDKKIIRYCDNPTYLCKFGNSWASKHYSALVLKKGQEFATSVWNGVPNIMHGVYPNVDFGPPMGFMDLVPY